MPARAPARVLTAENDPIIRADLRLVLQDAGFRVCAEARDGAEAIVLAREHRPDLILLDLSMPRIDGVEAAVGIRAERPVPFVALTGHVSGPLIRRAKAAGAAAVVVKPFREDAIVAAVCAALAGADEPPAPVDPVRERSRAALAEITAALGYPVEWADELERVAFARGLAWRRTR